MSGERFEGRGDSLETDQSTYSEISFVETRIAELVSGILRSLEEALGKLDAGTIKHSFGTVVLALVLIAQLEDPKGELRGAQAVMTTDQQSELQVTEKIKEFGAG